MGEKLLDTDPSLDREPLLGEMKAPVPKEDDFHDVKPLEAPESDQARNARGFGLAMGIFVTLMTYGYVQERIMTSNWDGMHGHEISSLFLVMCNRITSMMVAVTAILINRESFMPGAPFSSYLAISFSNMMATTCQYEALRYVSFPTQTLGKTAKMIPVMLWGSLIGGKVYKAKDYIVTVVVTLGTTLFLLTGPVVAKSAKRPGDQMTSLLGMGMMVVYLLFDGFTSTWQERLFKKTKVSTWNQMLYVGLLSALATGVGQMGAPIPTWNPDLYVHILALSLSAALAQIFILITIRDYGALLFATVMTTRQFLSILLSCLIFMHPLSLGQWAGTSLVFGALYFKTFSSMGGKNAAKERAMEEMQKAAPSAGK
mmetsp:Transcript_13511/g.32833  ORF Transcript_13511/g.32833 Transcript_13511/m.32833 type:complete len:371 (+) Transcript_13511:24-1136(+)